MIAVSSFRPLGQNAEWDQNQINAKRTWDLVFDEIIYLNEYEPALDTNLTTFLPHTEHPRIQDLCRICAMAPRWSCILNADIMVGPGIRSVEQEATRKGGWALTSHRYHERDGQWLVTDNGVDFFAALPWVWNEADRRCPPQLRIGHQTWDTWLLGLFNEAASGRFYDFTRRKCIFHPTHGDRRFVFDVSGALKEQLWSGMPMIHL